MSDVATKTRERGRAPRGARLPWPDARRFRRLVPAAVAFSVLGTALAFLLANGRSDVWNAAIDWRVLPAAVGLHVSAHIFWAFRYTVVGRAADVPLKPHQAWAFVTAGVFGGAVTPGRVGGEALKLALLARRGVRSGPAGRLLIADRAADLVFFMVLGVVAIILLPPLFGADARAAQGFAVLGMAVLAAFLLLLAALLLYPAPVGRSLERMAGWMARRFRRGSPQIQQRVHDFLGEARHGVLDVLGRRPALMALAMALTLANWMVEFAAVWLILQGLGHSVPYWAVFLVGIVLTMIANIPITPGGAGVAELAALSLLTPLAPGLSALFVVLWRGATYHYDLVVGGVVASLLLPRSHTGLAGEGNNP